jgi:hypothetical protein
MPKTNREIAREVDDILAGRSLPNSDVWTRGEAAYSHIQEEARAAESEAGMADNMQAVAVQRSPRAAHQLVAQSAQHADQAGRLVEHARAWVREARETPQFTAVERVLLTVQGAAARAKAKASSTKRAFEKRFGKYDPRGVLSSK